MSDMMRIFLVTICMILCYWIGRKSEHERIARAELERLHEQLDKETEDIAPVPEIGNEFWEMEQPMPYKKEDE